MILNRFFIDLNLVDDDDSSWFVPFNFATLTLKTRSQTSSKKKKIEKIISIAEKPDWFEFNKQQMGHYRVNYDFENWNSIINVLNSENYQRVHVLNRAQLVDDFLSFANAGLIDFDIASGILKYLRHEIDYIPWSTLTKNSEKMRGAFGGKNKVFNVSCM